MKGSKQLTLPLSEIKMNPDNPRYITEEKLDKLIQSIKDFPEMLNIRPLVINDEGFLIGGNMRYKALQKLGYTEVPVIKLYGITPEEEKEFLIKDNLGYGEWNWQSLLTDEWDVNLLDDWGIDFPNWMGQDDINDLDLDNLNSINQTPSLGKLKTIKLIYNDEDYDRIITGLKEINSDINLAVLNLLNITPDVRGN